MKLHLVLLSLDSLQPSDLILQPADLFLIGLPLLGTLLIRDCLRPDQLVKLHLMFLVLLRELRHLRLHPCHHRWIHLWARCRLCCKEND